MQVSATHMQAAQIHRFGAPDVFECGDRVRIPVLRPGEVLVRQEATSVNPIDCHRRSGYGRTLLGLKGAAALPLILGSDISGTVAEVGEGVTGLEVGDAVFGAKGPSRHGTYAEYCAVPAQDLALKPDSISFLEAAALPYAFLSAWAALCGAGFSPLDAAGKKVFLQGGSGGTGVAAIQVCKALGAHVATTAGPRGTALCRSLGADQVFDYSSEDFAQYLSDFDFAVCLATQDDEDRMLSILRRGPGSGYATLVHPLMALADERGLILGGGEAASRLVRKRMAQRRERRSYSWSLYKPNPPALTMLAGMVDSGAVRAVIDRTYALGRIAEAHQYTQKGRTKGKTVVRIG